MKVTWGGRRKSAGRRRQDNKPYTVRITEEERKAIITKYGTLSQALKNIYNNLEK